MTSMSENTPLLQRTAERTTEIVSITRSAQIEYEDLILMEENFNWKYGFQYVITKHNSIINAVCYTGKYVVSCSDDFKILVWIVNGKIELKHELPRESELQHSGAVVCLFVLSDTEILSGSYDGSIRKWNVETGECLEVIKEDDNMINECLALHCSNNLVIKGVRVKGVTNLSVLNPSRGAIHIFSKDSGILLKKLGEGSEYSHTDYVYCFVSTSDDKYLFSGSQDKSIRRWDLESLLNNPVSQKMIGHHGCVRSLCVTKDDLTLVSGSDDKTLRIWDITTRVCLLVLTGHEGAVRCVCMSGDGAQLVSGSEDKSIRLWDVETGAPIRILRGHEKLVTSVCTIRGQKQFLSCSSDKTVRLWDVCSSPILRCLEHRDSDFERCPVLSLCVLLGSKILSCTGDKFYIWDQDQTLPSMVQSVDNVEEKFIWGTFYDSTQNRLITVSSNHNGNNASIIEWSLDEFTIEFKRRWDYENNITCIEVFKHIIVLGFSNKSILIKDLIVNHDNILNYESDLGQIHCMEILESPQKFILIKVVHEGKDILISTYSTEENTLHGWCILQGHIEAVCCLAHTTDNRYILSGSDDSTIKMWSLPLPFYVLTDETPVERAPEHTFEGHTCSVISLCCIVDYLISGSDDTFIMVWCLRNRCRLRSLAGHTGSIRWLDATSAPRLFSASLDGTVIEWDLSVGRNVPSDEELQDLIRVRHLESGFCSHVTDVIEQMTYDDSNNARTPSLHSIVQTIGSNYSLSEKEKNDAQNEVKRLIMISARDTLEANVMSGMMKTFELRVKKGGYDLVPKSEEHVTIPLVHWMLHIPKYREHLIKSKLHGCLEMLCSCRHISDGNVESFLCGAVRSSDSETIYHTLKALSLSVKKNATQMMLHDHAILSRGENISNLFVDIEYVSMALKKEWHFDLLMDGILRLQKASDFMDNEVPPYAGIWDGDEEKILVGGCNNLFQLQDVEATLDPRSRWDFTYFVRRFLAFCYPEEPKLMEATYVPFPMSICRGQKLREHSSTLLLRVCVEGALRTDDSSVFRSSVLTAILTHKLKVFGWNMFFFRCYHLIYLLFYFQRKFEYLLILQFEFQIISIPLILFEVLLYASLSVCILLELFSYFMTSSFFLNFYGTDISVWKARTFFSLGLIFFILLPFIFNSSPDLWRIGNTILCFCVYLIIINDLKILYHSNFLLVFLRVVYALWSYVFFLLIYALGFALVFRSLLSDAIGEFEIECVHNNTLDSNEECSELDKIIDPFEYTSTSWVLMYMTLMGATDVESSAFNFVESVPLFCALVVLMCIFIFTSNVILNITIAVMNNAYEKVMKEGHAGFHLDQARYILRIERLLLYFGRLKLEEECNFPRWLLVLSPKSYDPSEGENDEKKSHSH